MQTNIATDRHVALLQELDQNWLWNHFICTAHFKLCFDPKLQLPLDPQQDQMVKSVFSYKDVSLQ